MGLVLFDRETTCTAKNIVNASLSIPSLFDGYLTEKPSYPHFEQMACLIGSSMVSFKTHPNTLFSGINSLDDNLNEWPFKTHGGLSKMCQLFGDKIEKIINELNEELAA